MTNLKLACYTATSSTSSFISIVLMLNFYGEKGFQFVYISRENNSMVPLRTFNMSQKDGFG